MDVFESLTAKINSEVDRVETNMEAFRLEILRKIEDARNNEILASIKTLGNRLDSIERRLPPEEETD